MAVIAFIGSFGSGCTALSELLVQEHKYSRISMDTVVRADYFKENKRHPANLVDLYDFADEQRKRYGTDYYAKLALDSFKGPSTNLIINNMKHVDEVLYVKRKFPKIIIFGVLTERADRWERLKDAYHGDKNAFDRDDKREQGIPGAMPYRQSMNKCFAKSNVIIRNFGGPIVSGNPQTEALKAVLLEKIAYYSRHPPSESSPDVIDGAEPGPKWEWKLDARGTMALMLVAAAIIGAGVIGMIGYSISPNNAVVKTTLLYTGAGIEVGLIIGLVILIAYGEWLKYRKSEIAEKDGEDE